MRPQGVSSGITDQLYSGRNDPMPDDPMDLVDAERQRTALITEKTEIQAALSDRNVTNESGGRISDRAYQTHRTKLVKRFNKIDARLRYLKAWINEKRGQQKLSNALNKTVKEIPDIDSKDAFMDAIIVELRTISESLKKIGVIVRKYGDR